MVTNSNTEQNNAPDLAVGISAEQYDEAGFWAKVKNFGLAAGKQLVEKALWLYFAAQRPDTPIWAKTVIYSTLAYFIFPFDAIPDITPVVGYADDLGAISAALVMLAVYIDDEVRASASKKMAELFGKG